MSKISFNFVKEHKSIGKNVTADLKDTIRYIMSFLLGVDRHNDIIDLIGYTDDKALWSQYKVVIRPSSFFDENIYGSSDSLPHIPVSNLDGIPIIYGGNNISVQSDIIITDADIIASSFFMLSRYEEFIDKSKLHRDIHLRYIGTESFPYRAGFLHLPIVDFYGRLLRQWLNSVGVNVPEPEHGIKSYNITHDLDIPYYCKRLRGVVGAALRCNAIEGIRNYIMKPEKNKFFTFPYLKAQCDKLRQSHPSKTHEILFVKSIVDKNFDRRFDNPVYDVRSSNIKTITDFCKHNGIEIGVHLSYHAGMRSNIVKEEISSLRSLVGVDITKNRDHYLRTLSPEDYESLEFSGIIDDYTLAYPDTLGYKTGTCHPHFFINPSSCATSKTLLLHPLTLMDCTVGDNKYMHLSVDESFRRVLAMIEFSRQFGGEVTILFHNQIFSDRSFDYRSLYQRIINELMK